MHWNNQFARQGRVNNLLAAVTDPYSGQPESKQAAVAIAAWQPRLQALAADLPAQAWLTRLEYQGVLLTLDGLALNLQALTSVEAALTRVAGFAPAKAGGTQRDAEGRWQFSFSLTGARADAD